MVYTDPMPRDKEKYNAYMREYILRRYHRRMEEARTVLGNRCENCGATEGLELDHIDPTTKLGSVAKIWSYSQKRFDEEVQKCQLLCDPCHQEKHASTFPCGTAQKYWRGCRCDPCTAANTKHSRQYKQDREQASLA